VIGEELRTGMNAVFPSPVAVSVDHPGCKKTGAGHLVAAERIVAAPHLAIAEIRLASA